MTRAEKSCGVVYIASGEFHAQAAAASARSVRVSNPWLEIDLFTDEPGIEGPFDRIIPFADGHLRSKVDHLASTRFLRTLYLDSDTQVVADLKPMFELLGRFDLAIAHAHARNANRQNVIWRTQVPEAFPQHNGGVLLYRGEGRALNFMQAWKTAYHEAGFKWDQITLRELLWKSDLDLYILPPEYNVRYRKYLEIWEEREAIPKILHMVDFFEELERQPGTAKRRDKGLANLWAKWRRAIRL